MRPLVPAGIVTVFLLAASGFTPPPSDDCEVTGTRSAIVDATGAERVRVEAAAGSLRIEGDPELTEVRARGEACASDAETLERIRLVAGPGEGGIVVRAEMPDSDGSFFSGGRQARLDLVLRVPARMTLDVRDGSGGTEIRGVAAVAADDGSGGLRIEDVAGDVRVEDGSGSLGIARIRGDVELEDGSGSIDVREVTGSVALRDGSGSIRLEGVGGSVTIRDDGSGSIRAADVSGDVVVRDDGSGSIDVARIGGDFIVRDDGSGGIAYSEVEGRVRIPEN